MARDADEQMANLVKANFGLQFIRLMSGSIGPGQFAKYAIIRPIKFVIFMFLGMALITLLPIEAYCWYAEHTSFTYHLVKGDLDSISGKNSRLARKQVSLDKPSPLATAEVQTPSQKGMVLADISSKTEAKNDEMQTSARPSVATPTQVHTCGEVRGSPDDPGSVCQAQLLDSSDKELNALYRSVMASLAPDDAAILKKDERAWVRLKESECQGDAACLLARTDERIVFLRKTYNNQQSDH